MTFLSKKSINNRFEQPCCKISCYNKYFYIGLYLRLNLLLFKLWQKRFSPEVTKLRPFKHIEVRQVGLNQRRLCLWLCEFSDVPELWVRPNPEKGAEKLSMKNTQLILIFYAHTILKICKVVFLRVSNTRFISIVREPRLYVGHPSIKRCLQCYNRTKYRIFSFNRRTSSNG